MSPDDRPTGTPEPRQHTVVADAAEHITEARQRARQMLGGEAHLAPIDDWRRMLVGARDALILVWLTWVALQGFGDPPFSEYMLVTMAIATALLSGISTGRATYAQVEYYASELERERREIRDHFEHECDEVRALYAAKGFRDPLLGEIVDTLAADDDRLLKVMMEEELGLSLHHVQHPLMVGLWNSAGSLLAGLILALPAVWLSRSGQQLWIATGGVILLAFVSLVSARATGRGWIEFFAVGLLMAIVVGGVVYYLAQWFSGFLATLPSA